MWCVCSCVFLCLCKLFSIFSNLGLPCSCELSLPMILQAQAFAFLWALPAASSSVCLQRSVANRIWLLSFVFLGTLYHQTTLWSGSVAFMGSVCAVSNLRTGCTVFAFSASQAGKRNELFEDGLHCFLLTIVFCNIYYIYTYVNEYANIYIYIYKLCSSVFCCAVLCCVLMSVTRFKFV